jgi:hypothetical protein
VCVLTGEATKEDIVAGDIKPTLTFNSVNDLFRALVQFVNGNTIEKTSLSKGDDTKVMKGAVLPLPHSRSLEL